MVKTTLLAIGLTAGSAALAYAAEFVTPPVPLDLSSELVLSVVNTCATPATFDIAVINAMTGQVLRHKQGTLAIHRGTALPYSFGSSQTGANVYEKITVECQDGARATPLVAFAVRDLQSKVPRFVGGTLDGTGI